MEIVEIKYVKSRANRYHVPVKAWKHWSPAGRQRFNEVYSSMRDQSLFCHPKMPALSKAHWKTICWNAAWVAATA